MIRTILMERRRATRRTPSADEPLSRVRLRAGSELSVVDVSDAGLLVEGNARLLPGTHVDVHVVTHEGRVLVRSRVIRAYVSELRTDRLSYRGALAFDRVIDASPVGYVVPGARRTHIDMPGTAYLEAADSNLSEVEHRLTA